MLKLYDYFRSSTAYRVRIALALKNIPYEMTHINLLEGEQQSDSYKQHNPSGGVPCLVDGDVTIAQSLAIIEYLEEKSPSPALVSGDAEQRALIRQLSLMIACDIHPLINLKVMGGYLGKTLGVDEAGRNAWYAKWVGDGLAAYETLLSQQGCSGRFSVGDSPSMADICLIPQLYSARRYKLDLSAYPKLCMIEKNCIVLPAFQKAAPEMHPNAPEGLEVIHGPKSLIP